MLVGIIRGEAVYSVLLEVSNTICICTKWLGRGLRLGVNSAAFVVEISFLKLRFLWFWPLPGCCVPIHVATSGIDGESRGRKIKEDTKWEHLCV